METIKVKKGEIIFREGDESDCLYYISGSGDGKVGFYSNYGTSAPVLLREETVGSFFGEMGVLGNEPRSATAVAMTDILLDRIEKSVFRDYFISNPAYMLELLKQVSNNLRGLTDDYMKACDLVKDYVSARESGSHISDELKQRLKELSSAVS